mmetsp:Transcript_33111/g.46225  ORF Transcript_33111/g.46225 Transcript_33111/m.46225 type:complete len:392 (+) Transcript_33111:108-1283(+)
MRGPKDDFWGEDSDGETESLNPEYLEKLSIEEEGGALQDNGWPSRSKLNGKASRRGQPKAGECCGICRKWTGFDRFTISVWLLLALGVSLIIPGVTLRMEFVPTPLPFIALPLHSCDGPKGSSVYILSNTPCSAIIATAKSSIPAVGGEFRAKLREEFLFDSIHYIPRLAFPEKMQLSVVLSFELLSQGEVRAKSSIKFDSSHGVDKSHTAGISRRLGVKGTEVLVYLPNPEGKNNYGESPAARKMCSNPSGCTHRLSSTMTELAITQSVFSLSSTSSDDASAAAGSSDATATSHADNGEAKARISMPVDDLEIVLRNVAIQTKESPGASTRRTADTPVPEVLLSFHQYELTPRQDQGVKIAIAGVAILFAGLSLECLSRIMMRIKGTKER